MTEHQLRLIEEVKALFYDDYFIEAHDKITTMESEFKDDSEFLSRLNSIEEVTILKDSLNGANSCLELLADLDSWELVKDEEDIATFTKSGSNQFIVRAEMIVEAPIFSILSLFSEIDLISSWVEVIEHSTMLAQPTSFTRLLWYRMNLPWPCSDRDIVVSAIGIPIPENRSVLINIKSVKTPTFLNTSIPAPAGNDIRIDMSVGCINLMILEPGVTQVSLISHSDPHLAFLPQPLINFGTKHGIFFFMRMLREKAKNFKGSEFERRVSEKSDYYKKIEDFYNRLFKEDSTS
jgi:hypothetical protein